MHADRDTLQGPVWHAHSLVNSRYHTRYRMSCCPVSARVSFIKSGTPSTACADSRQVVNGCLRCDTGPERNAFGEEFIVAHVMRPVAGKGQAYHAVENINGGHAQVDVRINHA